MQTVTICLTDIFFCYTTYKYALVGIFSMLQEQKRKGKISTPTSAFNMDNFDYDNYDNQEPYKFFIYEKYSISNRKW